MTRKTSTMVTYGFHNGDCLSFICYVTDINFWADQTLPENFSITVYLTETTNAAYIVVRILILHLLKMPNK